MSTATDKSAVKQAFIQGLTPPASNGYGNGLAKREQAAEAISQLEFPTRKWESWKYTDVTPLVSQPYQWAPAASLESVEEYLIPELEADLLVFVNGAYAPSLSQLGKNEGVVAIHPLNQLPTEKVTLFEQHFGSLLDHDTIFSALNTAYAKEGVLVHVPKGKIAQAPLHILHLSTTGENPQAEQHRNLFVIERQAEMKVVESHHSLGNGKSLLNAANEIFVGENASLEYIKLQHTSDQASQLDHTVARQARHSRFSMFTLTFSGDIVRNDLTVHLDEPETESHLMGVYLLSGKQQVDNYTNILHKKPNSFSNELYKGILADKSTAAFSGKIHVFQEAQKTNAFQSNRSILLSDSANIYTKPQLEIYADDVQCSHGATTGKLEEDAMFYLRSRGIKEEDARLMLIHAFAGEVIEAISLEAVRTQLEALIEARYKI